MFASAPGAPPTPPTWGAAERAWLKVAHKAAGHNQADCAADLKQTYGVAAASQADVSRWISGNILVPRCVRELLAYCEQHAPGARLSPDRGDAGVAPRTDEPVDTAQLLMKEVSAHLGALRTQIRREQGRSRRLSSSIDDLTSELTDALAQLGKLEAKLS